MNEQVIETKLRDFSVETYWCSVLKVKERMVGGGRRGRWEGRGGWGRKTGQRKTGKRWRNDEGVDSTRKQK